MTIWQEKKHFSKWEDLLKPYKIIDNKVEIKKEIKKEIDKYFPYNNYLKIKEIAEKIDLDDFFI